MAKRSKKNPSGTQKPDDDSLLLRSAESLGRMIGHLQRQLDGATKRLSATADDLIASLPRLDGTEPTRKAKPKARSTGKAKARKAVAKTSPKTAATAPAARKKVGARNRFP